MAAPSAILPSDALVFFGASGDLAYEQIFPSLLGLVRDEGLDIPIIGVAKSGWNLDKLKNRAKDSLAQHGAVDKAAQDKLLSLLHYIDGDYADPSTFSKLHEELGEAKQPLHYLAVPPSLFGTVAVAVRSRPCIRRKAQPHAAETFPGKEHLSHRPLPWQGTGAESALHAVRQSDVRADLEPRSCAQHPDHHGRGFRRTGSRGVL